MACYKELVIPVDVGAATAHSHRLVMTDGFVNSSQAAANGATLIVQLSNDTTATITYAQVANYASLVAFQSSVKTLLTDSTINSVTLANQTVTEVIIS